MEPPDETPPTPGPIEPRPDVPSFALTRQSATLTDLLSKASSAWSRDLMTWVLAMLLYWLLGFGIPGALSFAWGFFSAFQQGGDPGATFVAVDIIVRIAMYGVQMVLSAVFTLGIWAMAVRGLHEKTMSVGVIFSQLSKVGKYILQSLAMMLGVVLAILPVLVIVFLMFVGPIDLDTPMTEIADDAGRPLAIALIALLPVYIYFVTGIAFMQAELAFNDDAGPIDAMIYSWRIARGKRWKIIGVGLLAALITTGSAMLCGVGLLFGAPLAALLFGALYLALRDGADVPSANTGTTLGRHY